MRPAIKTRRVPTTTAASRKCVKDAIVWAVLALLIFYLAVSNLALSKMMRRSSSTVTTTTTTTTTPAVNPNINSDNLEKYLPPIVTHEETPPRTEVAVDSVVQPLEEPKSSRREGIPGKRPPPRLYCMIPTMYSRRKLDQWRAIALTWGPSCDVLKFFVDPVRNPREEDPIPSHFVLPETGFTVDIVVLEDMVRVNGNPCYTQGTNPDGTAEFTPCKHIWEKVWRSWVWVSKHDADLADYFFKIDDDTYFIPEAMRETIRRKGWTPAERRYFGAVIYPHGPKHGMIAGALVGFSRATMLAAAAKYETMEHEYGDRRQFRHGRCVDRDGATEEVTTSRCLREIGIEAEPIRDEQQRARVLVWTPATMLTYKRKNVTTSWFYQDQPWDVGTEENCCSSLPVGFHFLKNPDDIVRIHNLLIDPRGENELEKLCERNLPEWRAMLSRTPNKIIPRVIFEQEHQPPLAAIRFAEYFLKVKAELKTIY